jgi:hypothetical protein
MYKKMVVLKNTGVLGAKIAKKCNKGAGGGWRVQVGTGQQASSTRNTV